MTITIKDIANIAGVSYSTVSKALNDSPLVKDETKRKIVGIAKEMGYEPNLAAQRLVSKNTRIIGLIWPTIERTTLSTLVTKISNEMAKTPYSMILSVDPIKAAMETFKKFQVDGMILFEENVSSDIDSSSIPLISYGVTDNRPYKYPVVDANHKQAMDDAITYLYGLGHRSITYIGNISPFDPFQLEKYEGFNKAMRSHGLQVDDNNVINTEGLDWYHGYTAAKKMLDHAPLPTAIVGGSYDISNGIIRSLKENNISIPKDISIISYDNIPQMANTEIPMSCIGVPVEKLASEIVQSIIEFVETKQIEPKFKKMKPTLVERSSCAYAKM